MIETDRLIIRPWQEYDVDHYIKLANDMGYNCFAPPGAFQVKDLTEAKERVASRMASFAKSKLGKWPLFLKGTGEFVGTCGFDPYEIKGQQEVELGYRICLAHWGKGYATEAARAMMEYAFEKVGVSKIHAFALAENIGSLKVIKRLGLVPDGKLEHAGLLHDLYNMTATEFREVKGAWTRSLPTLETKRLCLRPLRMEDSPSIFTYAGNPNVSLYTLWEPHKTLADSEAFVNDYALTNYRAGVPEPFGVAFKENPDEIIGTVGCFWVSGTVPSLELAYAFGEEHWGKGIAAEASCAVLDHVFENYAAKRIQARCKAENVASARVMEKLGMKYEGTLRRSLYHRGRPWDMKVYALLAEEWHGSSN